MSYYANYDKPIHEAAYVLWDSDISEFPVDLKKIQRRYKNLFQIRSYKQFMMKHDATRAECISFFDSDSGSVASSGNGTYIIYYNDAESHERIRFTIAHEIGHIFLDHLSTYGTPILSRNSLLDDALYDEIEKEANCFARNLLCPVFHAVSILKEHGFEKKLEESHYVWVSDRNKRTALTQNLNNRIDSVSLLAECFDISDLAARTRIDFLSTDETHSTNPVNHDTKNLVKNIRIKARWRCNSCGAERHPGALYCISCGRASSFSFTVRTRGIDYRHGIRILKNRYEVCPICGNNEYSRESRFCKLCGAKTIYQRKVLVEKARETLQREEYEMIYNDGPEQNDNRRAIKCPKCGNEEFSDDAEYCKICGLQVYNYCAERHRNVGNARFCETCGRETVYYEEGLLQDWEVISRERK